ncbi:CgeB family protein [Paenibacillus physcomitrellae]|uniref:Spore maturation protein n=1 Tax=Paenibacillus physcomitrellae TaxID=1619311 RepID=A0ABQ1G200_9BACL|nr:glycosyltransferase [Paenibacillus physcomitrellae]GGA35920.1 spore maturation protein [Paenibacillus physcomitrellae]
MVKVQRLKSRARKKSVPVYSSHAAETAKHEGRSAGLRAGFEEGYLRGRMDVIASQPQTVFPLRNIHVMYVSSGKGFPYSPFDEGMVETLRSLAASVTPAMPNQPVAQLAAEHHPDLVMVFDGLEMPTDQIDAIRAMGIPTAVWLTDDPYYTDMTSQLTLHYDYVFTLELNCVEYYRQLGCPNVYYLPFGVYPGHFRPLRDRAPEPRTVSFVGSAYWNRVHFFQPIIDDLMKRGMRINGIWWDRLVEAGSYADRIEQGTWLGPQDTAVVYSSSKISLNMHRSYDDDSVNNNTLKITAVSPNPRTFEIAASGSLQLVDARNDLARFYTPGVEIDTYASQDELLSKIDFYLTHEAERREMVLRALERTMREHTYSHRLNELLTHIFG